VCRFFYVPQKQIWSRLPTKVSKLEIKRAGSLMAADNWQFHISLHRFPHSNCVYIKGMINSVSGPSLIPSSGNKASSFAAPSSVSNHDGNERRPPIELPSLWGTRVQAESHLMTHWGNAE